LNFTCFFAISISIVVVCRRSTMMGVARKNALGAAKAAPIDIHGSFVSQSHCGSCRSRRVGAVAVAIVGLEPSPLSEPLLIAIVVGAIA
jgi:hypothetical protein